jgi:predicted nucleic acid-binding protein
LKLAYVDSSCLVAIAFGEPGYEEVVERLNRCERLFSSNLLEAELRAALAREGAEGQEGDLLSGFIWIYPNRQLTVEYRRILAAGTLKGADLWHVACALFLSPEPKELAFLTLDRPQRAVARALGFPSLE